MALEDLIARKPKAEFEITLRPETVAEFHERGFTAIPRITTDEEVAWLAEFHDAMLTVSAHLRAGFIGDVINPVENPRADAPSQFIMPEQRFAVLKDTAFWRNGRKLAAQLLATEADALEGWGHIVRKPPHGTDPVPWHQDEGYWDTAFDYSAVACWMPLDPARVESGCMRFIPGSHCEKIRKHRFLNDDPRGASLVVDDIDEDAAVPSPIQVGGASFHHCRTLHSSGPNATDRVRRAHICEWQLPPRPRAVPANRPWVAEGHRAKAAAIASANRR